MKLQLIKKQKKLSELTDIELNKRFNEERSGFNLISGIWIFFSLAFGVEILTSNFLNYPVLTSNSYLFFGIMWVSLLSLIGMQMTFLGIVKGEKRLRDAIKDAIRIHNEVS